MSCFSSLYNCSNHFPEWKAVGWLRSLLLWLDFEAVLSASDGWFQTFPALPAVVATVEEPGHEKT